MSAFGAIGKFLSQCFFNVKWRCNVCGKEIFEDKNFCSSCESKLPFIKENYCNKCGRKLIVSSPYCSTCKDRLTSLDTCRSVFSYENEIATLIKKAKFGGKKYILEIFAEYLAKAIIDYHFEVDALVFVPMTKRAKRKRGYNQSEIMARLVGEKLKLPVLDCVEKVKETKRQASLDREQRLKNLENAFKIKIKADVEGKDLLIIDDVTTTGSTAEALAKKLKSAAAMTVNLLTVASVAPQSGY